MDRTEKRQRFDWLPAQMPGVAKQIADKRAELGDAHINLCWQRGVVQGRPGWFWASEGALHVGTLWPDAMEALKDLQRMAADLRAAGVTQPSQTPVQALPLLILRPVAEVSDGA